MSNEKKSEFLTDESGCTYCVVNGIRLNKDDIKEISPDLQGAFEVQDEEFGKKMQLFCYKRNKDNLHPKIDSSFERFFQAVAEYYHKNEEEYSKSEEYEKLYYLFHVANEEFMNRSNADWHKSVKDGNDMKSDRILSNFTRGLSRGSDNIFEVETNKYEIFYLSQKYNLPIHETLYSKILVEELKENNPYPNIELITKITDSLSSSKEIISMHSTKHLFDRMFDREETIPFTKAMFDRAGRGFLDGQGDEDNFMEILYCYIKNKHKMTAQGIKTEDISSFQHEEIQNILQMNELRENLCKDKSAIRVGGNFVDVDGTLIKSGKLNTELYNSMLEAKKEGKPLCIISGENIEIQKNRLKFLGVDTSLFEFAEKSKLKGCIIYGEVVDDAPPYINGFCTVCDDGWQKPDKSKYFFTKYNDPKLVSIKQLDECRKNMSLINQTIKNNTGRNG